MKKLFLFIFIIPFVLQGQNTTTLKGVVTNKQNSPIKDVAVSFLNNGTTTNEKGYYEITIPVRKTIEVVFSHVSYIKHTKKITLRSNRTLTYSPILISLNKELNEVVVKNNNNSAKGIKTIEVAKVKRLPGVNAGVEKFINDTSGCKQQQRIEYPIQCKRRKF